MNSVQISLFDKGFYISGIPLDNTFCVISIYTESWRNGYGRLSGICGSLGFFPQISVYIFIFIWNGVKVGKMDRESKRDFSSHQLLLIDSAADHAKAQSRSPTWVEETQSLEPWYAAS